MTALPEAVWATVDLIELMLGEAILQGESGLHPWKIGYRIDRLDAGARTDQLGVAWVDGHGHDDGDVLAIQQSGSRLAGGSSLILGDERDPS